MSHNIVFLLCCNIVILQRTLHGAVKSWLFYDRNDSLRIAYIHTEKVLKDGKLETEYYSKLIKADLSGKDQVLPLG